MKICLHLHKPDWTFGGLPDLYLPDHEVALTYIYVRLEQPIEDGLVTLSSTSIDCNPSYQQQELISFHNQSYSGITFSFQPTHLSWYNLLCRRISESVFKLQLEKQPDFEKIEKIYIQLDVRKRCKGSAPN